jgi:hypothetical protein
MGVPVSRRLVGAGVAAVVIAVVLVALIAGGGKNSSAGRRSRIRSALPPIGAGLPVALLSHPGALAADIDRAQAIIEDRASAGSALAGAGRFEQLATVALERATPRVRRATLALLSRRAAEGMRANLAAASSLSELTTPQRSLPRWTIVQPPAPNTLLGYFRAAQSRLGVRWEYLAAIELIETSFGRVHGVSSAGAQGPMQFLPATWAQYGRGSIHNQRDAILGAARYLVANGAPRNMADALYHYNNSRAYVNAVREYAGRMRADPRAYDGYYYWQVVYARAGGAVVLPVGYPRARPVPIYHSNAR